MKILITGADGFIGSRLTELLVRRDFEVTALSYYNSFGYYGWLEKIFLENKKNLKIIQGDIRDLSFCYDITRNVDVVLHLAALIAIPYSYVSPLNYLDTNINGTTNICLASLKNKVKKIVHTSTSEVYGTAKYVPIDEKHPIIGQSPYSASKASSDLLVRAWHETYGIPVVLTNCSNNYGPYHFPEKLIPVVILKALAGESIPIYGKGDNVRDWLYVEDHADALLLVLQEGRVGESYNIGGGNELSNIDLVRSLCTILDEKKPREKGSYSEQIIFVADRPGHDARYAIDPSRIQEELGWKPSVTLEEGMALTVKWYLDNEAWWRPLLNRSGVGSRLGLKV